MGFFDRVKRAFGAKPKDEEQKPTTVDHQTSDLDQSAESVATEDHNQEQEDHDAANLDVAPESVEKPISEPSNAADDMAKNKVPVRTLSADLPESATVTEEVESKTQATDSTVENESVATEVTVKAEEIPVVSKLVVAEQSSVEQPSAVANDELVQPEVTDDQEPALDSAATTAINSEVNSEESTITNIKSTESSGEVEEVVTETEVDSETQAEATASDEKVKEYDQGLAKSRHGFAARLNKFLANFRSVDEDFFEDLEEMLIEADVGFETAMEISNQLRDEVKLQNAKTKKQIGQVIVEKMVDIYGEAGKDEDSSLHFSTDDTPTVFLFVGVNGAGKTTTIGKLATKYHHEGKKVLLAAGDTFRAGAIEQLAEWARRANVDVVTSKPGTDPASVVFDAVKKAKDEHYDILLVDTAGRLQNNVNLMNELAKIKRIIVRELPEAPQEVLLVLDASTGQNALNQAKQFSKTTDVTGLILTKLDGSSKGGIIIAIRNELRLPVKLVGLGEKAQDLQIFAPEKYVYGLFKDLIEA